MVSSLSWAQISACASLCPWSASFSAILSGPSQLSRSPYLHSHDSSQEMALSDMLLRTLRLSLSLLIQSSLSSYFHLFGFNSRQCIFPSPAEYQCFFLISGSPLTSSVSSSYSDPFLSSFFLTLPLHFL